jgi:hypothetical protein
VLKPLTVLLTLAALLGCAAPQRVISFSRAQTGDLPTSKLSVVGVVETTGVNFYSLFRNESQRSGSICIPVILDHQDQALATRLSGGRFMVTGSAIPIDELNQVLPNQYGEIHGRAWSGTRCTGQIAIYVMALKPMY